MNEFGELVDLHIDPRGFVYVRMSNRDRSFRTLSRYWRAIADARVASGLRRLIVVDELSGPPEKHEVQSLIRDVIKPRLGDARIAYVIARPASPELISFSEFYARQLGIAIRLFATTDAAIEWVMLA